jgi:hypothetical protein
MPTTRHSVLLSPIATSRCLLTVAPISGLASGAAHEDLVLVLRVENLIAADHEGPPLIGRGIASGYLPADADLPRGLWRGGAALCLCWRLQVAVVGVVAASRWPWSLIGGSEETHTSP